MKSQNRILAWLAIGLSLIVLNSMLMSLELPADKPDMRPLFMFLFLVPIGVAGFFLNKIESLITGLLIVILCVWTVVQPYYYAMPYSTWVKEKGLFEYAGYLSKPLLASGIIWQLLAFLILSFWAGFLSNQLKKKTEQSDGSLKAMEDACLKLEDERRLFLSQLKKYQEDITHLTSLILILSDLAKEVPSVLEIEGLLKLILDKAVKLFSATRCAIFTADQATNRLAYACSFGYSEQAMRDLKLTADENSGIVGWCAKNGKFLSMKEAEKDPYLMDFLRQNKFPVIFCQPILQRGKTVAVICVGEIEGGLDERELVRLTSFLANLGSIAIENAILMEKTKEQAIRDGLTGLYNHRHFYELLEGVVKKPVQGVLGVFLIDVDHFKTFNDTHGHQIGDLILQKTVDIIKQQIQGDDIVARYGGEEFAVVCVRREGSLTKALAEGLRKTIEQGTLQTGGLKLRVTISLGVSFCDSQQGLSANELVRRADEALYKAKQAGRNRVCIWGE